MTTTYGYARVSTVHQDLKLQLEALENYGVSPDNIYADKRTGKDMERDALKELLSIVQEGDTIIVKKLDRLGRSVSQVTTLIEDLTDKGIHIKSIDDGVDTSNNSVMSKAMIHLLAMFSEMERNFILERTAPAIAAAKAAGVKFGAKRRNEKEYLLCIQAYLNGEGSIPEILNRYTGLTEATFHRRLSEYKATKDVMEGMPPEEAIRNHGLKRTDKGVVKYMSVSNFEKVAVHYKPMIMQRMELS